MVKWSLQHEPERFTGQDTLWNMDHTLTWLPPIGDVNEAHLETLGNMISEALHQHKNAVAEKKRIDACDQGFGMGWSQQRARYRFLQGQEVTCLGLDLTLVVRFNEIPRVVQGVQNLNKHRGFQWNERRVGLPRAAP